MIDPAHLQFVLYSPGPGLRCSELFELLDKLTPEELDVLLTDLYVAYDILDDQSEEESPKKSLKGFWYSKFKKRFLEVNRDCISERISVFGLVSYVLAETYRKSTPARFTRIIDDHRMLKGMAHRAILKEDTEMSLPNLYSAVTDLAGKISSLHEEVEVSLKVYRKFCEKVVTPLLTPR